MDRGSAPFWEWWEWWEWWVWGATGDGRSPWVAAGMLGRGGGTKGTAGEARGWPELVAACGRDRGPVPRLRWGRSTAGRRLFGTDAVLALARWTSDVAHTYAQVALLFSLYTRQPSNPAGQGMRSGNKRYVVAANSIDPVRGARTGRNGALQKNICPLPWLAAIGEGRRS